MDDMPLNGLNGDRKIDDEASMSSQLAPVCVVTWKHLTVTTRQDDPPR